MANPRTIELHALTAEASSSSSAAVDIGPDGAARTAVILTLIATVITGSLLVAIETSPNGSTGWREVGKFDVTGTGAQRNRRAFDQCDRYVRATWTVGGSCTFSVAGEAHVLFALREDLLNELPEHALSDIPEHVFADALVKASLVAEDAISTANPLPLTQWPVSVAQNSAQIAAFRVLKWRGFNPDAPQDKLVKDAHDEAHRWFRSVAKGELKPPGLVPPDNLGVRVSSGNPDAPDDTKPRFSDNWGDFG